VHRLVPHLAAHGVPGEFVHLLGPTTGIPRLDGGDDSRVQRAAAVLKQAAIRHLVGQGMPERVLTLREELDLVEKLRRLQPGERPSCTAVRSTQ
jgi:hypothetical protein